MNESLRQAGKPVILIIDNSISFTGAFKCALTEALLLQHRFDFIFIVPNNSTIIEAIVTNGFRYYTLPMIEIGRSVKNLLWYGPKLFQNAIHLSRILKKENVQVVQMNDFYNLLGVTAKWAGFKGALIVYVRFLPSALPAPLRTFWIRLAHRYAEAVVAVSDAVLRQLLQHKKNVRIYDAVELAEKLPAKTVAAEVNTLTFLYLANYIKGKGQDYAVKAFHAVAQQHKNVQLRFVGGDMGLQKNKEFKAYLQQYVLANGLSEQVVFENFQSDIEHVVKAADVVLNFAEAESFSMTCAEASYYGVPVIATRCGGPEEIIVHQQTGMLVGNRNVPQMQEAMQVLASSAALRAQYGGAARVHIRNKFSSELYRQQFTA